ncbi:MAG: succinate dehydrogenase assembly factor 2 [Aquabacterium sp.]|nr:succinate dehydrogenase assembly factor 2 [Burkholderiaceae bacterium]MCK6433666.1 succinate dehydrogenase assembly factor 2 [Aquabacterium sp.]
MRERAGSGEVERRRLRWRARRGLLENDILIGRFLDREGARLDAEDLRALEVLLALPDNDLLDLLLARKDPAGALDDNRVRALLARMRAA